MGAGHSACMAFIVIHKLRQMEMLDSHSQVTLVRSLSIPIAIAVNQFLSEITYLGYILFSDIYDYDNLACINQVVLITERGRV